MNTALIAARPSRHSVPSPLAAWLQRIRAAWTETTPNRSTAEQHLDRSATLWVRRPLARVVRCEVGTLWLAFDGEPQDVILEAGQSHRCMSGARLSIHALTAATFRLS